MNDRMFELGPLAMALWERKEPAVGQGLSIEDFLKIIKKTNHSFSAYVGMKSLGVLIGTQYKHPTNVFTDGVVQDFEMNKNFASVNATDATYLGWIADRTLENDISNVHLQTRLSKHELELVMTRQGFRLGGRGKFRYKAENWRARS